MGDALFPLPPLGRGSSAYPPVGTRATLEVDDDELEMLNRAGRYGWRAVACTFSTWTLEFAGAQWTHAHTFWRQPAGGGWHRVGRYWLSVYWAKPLHLPVLPGNPAPEVFRSERRLRRALSRAGVATGGTAVSGLLDGVRELVQDAVGAVEQAVLGTDSRAAHPPAPRSQAPVPTVVDPRLFDASEGGQRLRAHLTQLAQLAPVYAGYTIEGQPVPARLGRIVADMQDLFRRMHARATAHQVRMAQSHYAHVLGKLVLVVSPAYLKDVMDNPHLWDDTEQRVLRVSAALTVLDAEILDNVRRVNASADLDFQVALATITGLADDGGLDALYGRPTS